MCVLDVAFCGYMVLWICVCVGMLEFECSVGARTCMWVFRRVGVSLVGGYVC